MNESINQSTYQTKFHEIENFGSDVTNEILVHRGLHSDKQTDQVQTDDEDPVKRVDITAGHGVRRHQTVATHNLCEDFIKDRLEVRPRDVLNSVERLLGFLEREKLSKRDETGDCHGIQWLQVGQLHFQGVAPQLQTSPEIPCKKEIKFNTQEMVILKRLNDEMLD